MGNATVDPADIEDAAPDVLPTEGDDAVWDATLSDQDHHGVTEYHEIHLSGSKTEERDGKLVKGILRTGRWDETPTAVGKIKKPLSIVRDGKSNPAKGIISLQEILDNFKSRSPIKTVQIPFSDKPDDDHIKDGNLARVNTGFVDDLWIEDDEDGTAHLVGEVRLTDKDVRKKVLEGSLADGSAGVPFHSTKGAFLEHFCITNTPFIDRLKPFLEASDAPSVADVEIHHHTLHATSPVVEEEEKAPEVEPPSEVEPTVNAEETIAAATAAFDKQYGWSSSYEVQEPVTGSAVTIKSLASEGTWTVPYTVEDNSLKLALYSDWIPVENKEGDAKPQEETPAPPKIEIPLSGDEELDTARALRELQTTEPPQSETNSSNGGEHMKGAISREELDALPDTARAAVQAILDENAELKASVNTGNVDARIAELEKVGFSDRPGFLKLYRKVGLSDDGGPAAILFSDDGSEKTKVTARDLLDLAADALLGAEGKVTFSDQHIQTGDEKKPPVTDEPESREKRLQDARDFLAGKTTKKEA